MSHKSAREHLTTAMACLTLAVATAEEERQAAAQATAPGQNHLDIHVRKAVRTGDIAAAALTILEEKLKSFNHRAG